MKKYCLEYWRKKDGIISQLRFREREYKQMKGKIYNLLSNLITDLGGYVLYSDNEIIERG